MNKIVGIDLGTTNSLVATVDSGIPLVIADAEGRRLTPSVVRLPAGGGSPVAGAPAQRARAAQPSETLYSIKRFMGRRGSDITPDDRKVTYPMKADGPAPVTFPVHNRDWRPEDVSAEILRKLKRDAEDYFGHPVERAVITVPAYFNDAQRNATKTAGELAGFNVERIINEPTAAALAYGLDKLSDRSRIAVFDLGGGTFDLSILELNQGVFQVLATNGNTRLGGDDIDARLVALLADEMGDNVPGLGAWMRRDEPGTPAGNAGAELLHVLARVRAAAEDAKIRLSDEAEVEISLPFLTPQFSYQRKLSRQELEHLASGIVDRTRAHCQRSLADAKLEARDLDQVILVGGQTRMPLVRRKVAEWFGCAEFEETRGGLRVGAEYHRPAGPQLNTSQNPDEAVALGAAIQAEILAGGFQNVLLLDVTPLSLGIETFGGLMNVIIPRNSTIPVKAGEMFTTAVDHQRDILIHVLQGERDRAKDNWSLGKFTLEFEPAPRGIPRVGVQFEIDANGILHVLARDIQTGRQKTLEMKSAVDVEDSRVQAMVEESVEHAFEDLAARRWVEARLKADEILSATVKAVEELRAEIDAETLQRVEDAAARVRAALHTPEGAETGDARGLQAACAALDEATQPLADLLMEKATDALLRKRGL